MALAERVPYVERLENFITDEETSLSAWAPA
jgi:hypothetical protein